MALTTSVIEYILGRLHQIGVTDVFGVPGDFAFPIQDAIVGHPDINWIGCCNELNAGYAADGYARIRGVAALSTTYGVGELSAISAVAGSYAEHLPVFHITGMPARSAQADRVLVHHTLGNGEFDLFRGMADTVVAASAIITPANAVAETERLIAEAFYHRRPVYMAIPTDVVNAPVLAEQGAPSATSSNPEALASVADAIEEALNTAVTACILPGILLDRLGINELAADFAESAHLPFATMFADKSAIDERHSNYIGMYDGRLMDESVRVFVESATTVVTIGTTQTDFNTGAFTARLESSRTIDIGLHQTTVGTTTFHEVEMADLLRDLTKRKFKSRQPSGLSPESLSNNITESHSQQITAAALYPRWEAFLEPGDIVIAETGTVSMGLAFAHLPRGASFHNQTLWGAIGWATPAAFGAAVAAPDRRIVLFTGEGSHQLTVQEISQFHRLGLRPIIFVLNNSGYLIERLLCTDPDIAYNDLAPWRYASLPEAFGCDGWFTARTVTLEELDQAMYEAGVGDRAAYIEVVTGTHEAPELARRLSENVASLYSTK